MVGKKKKFPVDPISNEFQHAAQKKEQTITQKFSPLGPRGGGGGGT